MSELSKNQLEITLKLIKARQERREAGRREALSFQFEQAAKRKRVSRNKGKVKNYEV